LTARLAVFSGESGAYLPSADTNTKTDINAAVCEDVLKTAKGGGAVPPELNAVARNFIQPQQHRHTADYDNSKQWSRTDVLNVLTLATDAFTAWRAISTQDEAQDYLLQLFLPKLPKQ